MNPPAVSKAILHSCALCQPVVSQREIKSQAPCGVRARASGGALVSARSGDLQRVGGDQQVSVVEQGHLGPLHQHDENQLDEHHESQLADAADVQEHRAGQQGQHHAVAEVLQEEKSEGKRG